jgi:hypothetical protein
MTPRTNEVKKASRLTPFYNLNIKNNDSDPFEFAMDADVETALNNYQSTINRYNNADLSDPRIENVYFLERQIAYIGLQLALAKARIRKGMDPTLDYTSFESLLKFVRQCGQ